jgi:hypothetical protein
MLRQLVSMVGVEGVVADYRVKNTELLHIRNCLELLCIYVIHFFVMCLTTLLVIQTNIPSNGRMTVSNNF